MGSELEIGLQFAGGEEVEDMGLNEWLFIIIILGNRHLTVV